MNKHGWADYWLLKKLSVLAGLLAVVIIGGSLALLWTRQAIEETARQTRVLETEITKEERRLRYLDTKIAEIHQPLYLERQVRRLGLLLRPPTADQIIYINGPTLQRQALPEDPTQSPVPARDPFIRSIDLAVMEALKGE